ncbi:metastasis-associated protein MTA1-like isoform X1 [Rhagoletis pomonella]|uniref:metastasis-associated protein MTA1-like isoform X1 n=1 Tax=Rhagoletis pomonella TaxID=28610 RepID=UPI0017840F9B|nr:metastasis-associated protein MTA1-like isoform X1 [Rhagoletis pomonella]
MATNMYRVGDYVYVETNPNSPFLIRRIEELNKNQSGNVEAKVMCFYRRRDLPNPLVQLADKHQLATAEDSPLATKLKKTWLRTPVGEEQAAQAVLDPSIAALDEVLNSPVHHCPGGGTASAEKGEPLTAKQRYQIKHRELFLSRQVEALPATQIRGKCSVTLLNETESLQSYLSKDDTFFYCLVFDPNQKTLLADKGEIRVGSRYQSEIPAKLKDVSSDERKLEDLETLVWTSQHNLNDRKIDQFLVVSRSIGTFARALDCSSSVKQPSLHMSAAAASRDITLFHAMDTLHKHNYSIEEAMCSLVPSTGPVLCRDEIEDWSASEANLFEEALDKYGKDFNDIRQDFLPWKTLKQIIEYYYMWKTTDRYVQQKRVKAVEAELKLKQVYVPQYNQVNKGGSGGISIKGGANIYNGTTNGGADLSNIGKPCESCSTVKSSQWYPWTASGHGMCRLCQNCWDYWKKYGGLRNAAKLEVEPEPKKKAPVVVDVIDTEKVSDLSNRQMHKCPMVNCGKEFKLKTHLARHFDQAHGIAISSGSPRPIMKTRTAFYLHTNAMTRLARVLCRNCIKFKKAARQTSFAINTLLVKQEFTNRINDKTAADIKRILLIKRKKRERGSVTKIANRLGSPGIGPHEWLVLTPKDKIPKPDVVYFPKPPKAPDGSLLYDRVPNKVLEPEKDLTILPAPAPIVTAPVAAAVLPTVVPAISPLPAPKVTAVNTTPSATKPAVERSRAIKELPPVPTPATGGGAAAARRTDCWRKRGRDRNEEAADGMLYPAYPPTKRPNKDPMPSHRPSNEQFAAMMAAAGHTLTRHHLNGKPKLAQMGRIGNGRKQVISWVDAPDDYYFRASDTSKKWRKTLSPTDLRRVARKPWRELPIKAQQIAQMAHAVTAPSMVMSRQIESQVVILD